MDFVIPPTPKLELHLAYAGEYREDIGAPKNEVSSDWNRVLTRDQNPLIIPIGCSHLVWGFVVEGLGFTARA